MYFETFLIVVGLSLIVASRIAFNIQRRRAVEFKPMTDQFIAQANAFGERTRTLVAQANGR
jgi:hypothetical protein